MKDKLIISVFILSVFTANAGLSDSVYKWSVPAGMSVGRYFPMNPLSKNNLPYSFGSGFYDLKGYDSYSMFFGLDYMEEYGLEIGFEGNIVFSNNSSFQDYARNIFGENYIGAGVDISDYTAIYLGFKYAHKIKKFALNGKLHFDYVNNYIPPQYHIVSKTPGTNNYTIVNYSTRNRKLFYVSEEISIIRTFYGRKFPEPLFDIGVISSYTSFKRKFEYTITTDNFYSPIGDEQFSFRERFHGFNIKFYFGWKIYWAKVSKPKVIKPT